MSAANTLPGTDPVTVARSTAYRRIATEEAFATTDMLRQYRDAAGAQEHR